MSPQKTIMHKKYMIFGIIIAVFLVIFLSPFASKHPDGLVKIAGDKGFLGKAQKPMFTSPISHYLFPGIKNERLAIALAGVTGTLAVFIITFLLAVWLKK